MMDEKEELGLSNDQRKKRKAFLTHNLSTNLVIMIIIIVIIIINLIYIAQLDCNGILTALYIVIKHIQMQYRHI